MTDFAWQGAPRAPGLIGEGALRALLLGREERARAQRGVLTRPGVTCVCQVSLNIPGLPKRMDGDARALSLAAEALTREAGRAPALSASLVNGAGAALLLTFPRIDPLDMKRIAIAVEESAGWCRVLDIDVIAREGGVSRSSLGLPSRRCLLCGEEAKVCARAGAHSIQELREEVSRLLSRSFSSDASAR